MTRPAKASKAREHGLGLPKKPEDEPIEAVIFDMDGVVTQSMRAHFAAWKEVFDAFLKGQAEAQGGPYVPFSMEDYFTYVDGVPRFDGTRRFLNSRGIALPEGAPDSLDPHTIHGLGNRKNRRFVAWLEHNKVPTYADTLGLIRAVKDRGIKIGVFSASRNAEQVLESAGVLDLFDAKVDGVDAEELRLVPKPDPALLLETARRLGATPSRAVVVEDAVSGVKAGAAGGFKHVIGVDRELISEEMHYRALRASGADIVTRDLGDVCDLCCRPHGRKRIRDEQ
jgi:trehalose 6-phosphate phosphatase